MLGITIYGKTWKNSEKTNEVYTFLREPGKNSRNRLLNAINQTNNLAYPRGIPMISRLAATAGGIPVVPRPGQTLPGPYDEP